MTDSWYEDDNFWKATAPFMFSERRLSNTPLEVEQIIKLLEITPKAKILDLCCGQGRHSLEFARQGFDVIGVDRTISYLEKARQQANEEKLNIKFIEEDMRKFCNPNTFDIVLNLFTAFGYFKNPEENFQVLLNIYKSLKDNGKLIIEILGKEVLARIFKERTWHREDNDKIILEEHKVINNWSFIESIWILLVGDTRKEFKLEHWLYSASELSRLLKESGFKSVDVYGDLTGNPYDHTAKRLVVVGYK